MDGIALKTKEKISAAEVERRRVALRRADAHNRIEGITRDPSTDDIFESLVRGDVEAADVPALLKARLGLQ